MGDLLRLPTRHRDAVHPTSTPNALMNAQIVARMDDASISRTVQRLCERMDADEKREARRIQIRRDFERDLRAVEARLKVSKSHQERDRLLGLMRRARKALGEMER